MMYTEGYLSHDTIVQTGWPFDEACATNDTVTSVDATAAAAGISINDVVYAKCEQDSGHDPWLVRTEDWMTSEQATLVSTMYMAIHMMQL
jgi:hypothetical protein